MFVWDEDALNAEQERAVNEPGSVFLIACPGSGKTRTLTYKVASELSKLDSHKQFVAAITYTHRAADEMEERITSLGVDTDQLWIGTIHSFCLEWILKPYGLYHPELAQGFQVVNSHESETILDRLCSGYHNISIYDCGFHFTGSTLELECPHTAKHAEVRLILEQYFKELRSARQVDFEHILRCAFELIRDNPQISRVLGQIFSFIAIDEYQDTKRIQYAILTSIINAGAGATRTLIVGDPNQEIFTSMGGYAISASEFQGLIGLPLKELQLSQNYRSSEFITKYFGNFNVHGTTIAAASPHKDYASLITFNDSIDRVDLESEIVRLIRHNIEIRGISPREICIIAPWWVHLAAMTRKLVAALPDYEFDGPGLVPFSRDLDNFWYKTARIALTEASPEMYVRRLRWAQELINDLSAAGVDVSHLSKQKLLRESNLIELTEVDGLKYLAAYFELLLKSLGVDFRVFTSLHEQHEAFFASASARVDRLVREGSPYIADIATFRRVYRNRSGITVSTIHGVKGGEFDTVIAYAMLDGMVPHFNDPDQMNSARKLLYVIGSRARKNLHLIAERGRPRGRFNVYDTSVPLRALRFDYDIDLT
ncbi:ATP-dependent helicase [Rhodococcus maanshanensis]|uniref:UvrD-helicase domain-containing protein n=1 Tax=Rhodococcus maanshanensis TaxID=183556 RepID=UPI0022B3320F|nr:ATP-dependent helicase [Rhodococcus maanshanensis]MCZ4558169.1 ATP-dependent helicase [Rhodococcus maanshanensis]